MKHTVQTFYDMGFTKADNSNGPVIFEARRMGFMQGWMAVVDAINLPETSLSKTPLKCLYPTILLFKP